MSNDELRAKARDAARAAADGHDAAFGTRTSGDVTKRITEAILTLILPELDARVRAAREGALEEAAKLCESEAAKWADAQQRLDSDEETTNAMRQRRQGAWMEQGHMAKVFREMARGDAAAVRTDTDAKVLRELGGPHRSRREGGRDVK